MVLRVMSVAIRSLYLMMVILLHLVQLKLRTLMFINGTVRIMLGFHKEKHSQDSTE